MRHAAIWTTILACATPLAAAAQDAAAPRIEERSAADLSAAMTRGETSAEAATRAYLDRIVAIDRAGPALRSVIAVNPNALAEARALDAERRAGRVRGPLHGVPVLVKDNIETRDQPTTAGSLALAANDTRRDAPLIARLRAAGAVILGKTNLSEWANIRSSDSMSGWSAVGGLVRNPYALDRTACGSSSGTGAAIAASLGAIGVGTETDGSITCPAAMTGLVGLKPSMGLVSRTHIVPISHSQDIAGPMGRDVRDVAMLFAAMVGSDPADAATADADRRRRDPLPLLKADALRGVRVGVMRPQLTPDHQARYDAALAQLKAAGAVLVDVAMPDLPGLGEAEFAVLLTELKADLDAYLATTPPAVTARTLEQVIAFNRREAAREMPYFTQDIFESAAATKGLADPAYRAALEKARALAGPQGIDAILKAGNVAFYVSPTNGPAWPSDPVHGDRFVGPSASRLPAVAGYPHLTVPMGLVRGLPVGLSFIGPRDGDAMLLGAGYAFEAAGTMRVAPRYLPSVDAGPGLGGVR